jgi:hypothetical protein
LLPGDIKLFSRRSGANGKLAGAKAGADLTARNVKLSRKSVSDYSQEHESQFVKISGNIPYPPYGSLSMLSRKGISDFQGFTIGQTIRGIDAHTGITDIYAHTKKVSVWRAGSRT